MIRVTRQPEYQEFNRDVRTPGLKFLELCPTPNNKEFSKHEYWSRSRESLRTAYSRICAYTSFLMPGGGSIDHFIPKSKAPNLAYEWSNFRLCDERVNNWKKHSEVSVDPFFMQDDWLYLSFPECIIKISDHVGPIARTRLKQTIEILRLNKDDSIVEFRFNLAKDYVDELITLDFLKLYYPFVGSEIEKQGGRPILEPLFRG